MNALETSPDRRDVAAYLASGDLAAEITAVVGRWAGPGRPSLLVVLDWDPPFAAVYPEAELIEASPDVPVVDPRPIGSIGPGMLLVVVIDEVGETAYVIPDPRACN